MHCTVHFLPEKVGARNRAITVVRIRSSLTKLLALMVIAALVRPGPTYDCSPQSPETTAVATAKMGCGVLFIARSGLPNPGLNRDLSKPWGVLADDSAIVDDDVLEGTDDWNGCLTYYMDELACGTLRMMVRESRSIALLGKIQAPSLKLLCSYQC
jgi:hypothetical protein